MSITKRPTIKTAEDFIAGATDAPAPKPEKTKKGEIYPWVEGNERIVKGINLRLPEPLWLKLDYIRSRTNLSMQKIVMQHLLPGIEKQIQELTGEDGDSLD